ncbi:nuclear transport factor 2 family protein [Telmatospirillum siberiense]|uniref:Nuclear transport factor 2 family protein n=1 Tax=Telmatospirillum siberiense TaxID=382514 RepID=A0A2N3PPG2_9PROT|nr:nuclear transport factor 2 family protein [Telmatospirillum siberiense]PKU22266.1 nuclear transport factor 2 family protein [Telmatospirillum siberiense]
MSPLDAWGDFWEGLTPGGVARLRELCAPHIRFVDPFNDLTGVERLEALLVHMFQTLEGPRFVVEDRALGRYAGYLRWHFSATLLRGGPIALEGMSEVRFDATGKVILHQDHWDAGTQVYGRIPVLGAAIRLIRKRLSAPAS